MMRSWIEFFRNKNYGWRFKIVNFITGDRLFIYLSNAHIVAECMDYLIDTNPEFAKRKMKQVREDLEYLMFEM